jgi:DNA-binding NarL/FixJ family response regulator
LKELTEQPRAGPVDFQPEDAPPDLAGVRVLLVDDQRLFADALRLALERLGVVVVGVATTGQEAIEAARRNRPDVVLLDLGLPDLSGLPVGRRIIRELPDAKILAVTAYNDAWVAREAIGAGFHGYVTKDTPMSRFVASITAALSGQFVIPQVLAQAASRATPTDKRTALARAELLSPRELEVLALLVEGASGKGIADQLSIARNTVRTHVQSILVKLEVHSRLEAVAFAIQHGVAPRLGEKPRS